MTTVATHVERRGTEGDDLGRGAVLALVTLVWVWTAADAPAVPWPIVLLASVGSVVMGGVLGRRAYRRRGRPGHLWLALWLAGSVALDAYAAAKIGMHPVIPATVTLLAISVWRFGREDYRDLALSAALCALAVDAGFGLDWGKWVAAVSLVFWASNGGGRTAALWLAGAVLMAAPWWFDAAAFGLHNAIWWIVLDLGVGVLDLRLDRLVPPFLAILGVLVVLGSLTVFHWRPARWRAAWVGWRLDRTLRLREVDGSVLAVRDTPTAVIVSIEVGPEGKAALVQRHGLELQTATGAAGAHRLVLGSHSNERKGVDVEIEVAREAPCRPVNVRAFHGRRKRRSASDRALALGTDTYGRAVWWDPCTDPHLALIGGAGKTTFAHNVAFEALTCCPDAAVCVVAATDPEAWDDLRRFEAEGRFRIATNEIEGKAALRSLERLVTGGVSAEGATRQAQAFAGWIVVVVEDWPILRARAKQSGGEEFEREISHLIDTLAIHGAKHGVYVLLSGRSLSLTEVGRKAYCPVLFPADRPGTARDWIDPALADPVQLCPTGEVFLRRSGGRVLRISTLGED